MIPFLGGPFSHSTRLSQPTHSEELCGLGPWQWIQLRVVQHSAWSCLTLMRPRRPSRHTACAVRDAFVTYQSLPRLFVHRMANAPPEGMRNRHIHLRPCNGLPPRPYKQLQGSKSLFPRATVLQSYLLRRWDWSGFGGSKYLLRRYGWSPREGLRVRHQVRSTEYPPQRQRI